jgi:uncharacterized caspase-like protein
MIQGGSMSAFKKKAKTGAIASVLMLSFAVSAAADAARIALVVGNSAYSGEASLKNPANDASDMAAALKRAGWSVSVAMDADRRAFNRAIGAFRDSLAESEGANALFYYAGHGIQTDGRNYLLPVRTDFETIDDVRTEAIDLQAVTDAIAQGKAGVSLLILDACRDNPFAKKMTRSLGGARGLSVVPTAGGASGSVIMFSTSPGDVALDGGGRNGVFTGALLKYVESDLKVEELFKKVTGDVRSQSVGAQNPWINASLPGDFYIISDSLRAAKAAEKQKAVAAAKQAELDKIAEQARAEEAVKTAAARQDAEAAKMAAEAALALVASERNRPKGRLRVESSISGRVFAGTEMLGEVGPDTPLMSDSMPTGRQELRFISGGSIDETKAVTITDKAYVVVSFGPAVTGKAALGSAPGAISITVYQEGAYVSLDGGAEVELPHIFEGVSAGSHVLKIEDFELDTKIFKGFEETVMVEPGKRLNVEKALQPAISRLRVSDIPAGARLVIDGEELTCAPAPEGGSLFEATVDAGKKRIDVILDNKTWSTPAYLTVDGAQSLSVKNMQYRIALQRRSIKVNGKDDDWAGIEPIFGPATYSPPNQRGIRISGGSLCRDDKNLYIRIDVANGMPKLSSLQRSTLLLSLSDDGTTLHLSVTVDENGKASSNIYNWISEQSDPSGSFSVGPAFVEMSFPISKLRKKLKLLNPIQGSISYWVDKDRMSYGSKPLQLIIGE